MYSWVCSQCGASGLLISLGHYNAHFEDCKAHTGDKILLLVVTNFALTFRSSRFDGRGPGLIDETQVWPEKVVFTGERGVVLTEVDEEFELLTICSFDCLE